MNASVTFHPGAAFGILNIKTPPGEPLVDPHTVLFGVDVSGSMSDLCADGRSKIQHATHTTKNLYRMLTAHPGTVRAGLYGFDDRIKPVRAPTDLTEATLDACLREIDTALYPCGGTHLEAALKHASREIADLKQTDPQRPVTHILMTDGNATEGCRQVSGLTPLVNGDAANIFIGYGIDHSADCLSALGDRPNADYYFIDQIEKGGLVFGEIFHSIFYKRYTNLTLGGHGVEFYDFRTNTWGKTLSINAWTSDTDKTYHLRRLEGPVEDAAVLITGFDLGNKTYGTLTRLTLADAGSTDLQKYLYRQRTQELMYQAKTSTSGGSGIAEGGLKTAIRAFLGELKGYMTAQVLETDPFYLALCDDLAITLRTFGTVYGQMFATGRSNSNGYERAYNICALPPLRRSNGVNGGLNGVNGGLNRVRFQDADEEEAEASDLHTISTDAVFTPRLTPSMSRAMRSTSQTFS